MLLFPKTAVNFRLPISPLKLIPFASCRSVPVNSPRPIALSRSPAGPLRRAPLPLLAFSTAATSAEPPSSAAMAAATVVEHVVLFKVRDGTDPVRIDAMMSNLTSLASLDGVLHLVAAPVLRLRSSSSAAFGFTHLLHSRYRTKDDLAVYAANPTHISVVREKVLPICDDLMAVDWVGQPEPGPDAPRPGSAARVTLAKLTEAAGEAGKEEVLAALGGVRGTFPEAIEQFSYGENFSPARAKGFSVCSIAVFPSLEVLDALDDKGGDLMEAQKERVRPLLQSVIVLDFLVPPPPATTSGL